MLRKIKQALPFSLRKNIKLKYAQLKQKQWEIKHANSPKIFGIGYNKTGTTSLEKAMRNLGYKVGDQRTAELLHKEWGVRNFTPIIKYCKTAEFFQDVPFSKPFTFIALDQAFPNSKFILTIRDDPEQWYNSLIKFHTKLWSHNDKPPTPRDLKNAKYVYKGWAWELNRLQSATPENNPYDKKSLINSYNEYNKSVIDYFKNKNENLLVLNVAEKGVYCKLCEFLNQPVTREEFPWENKT